MNNQNQIPYKRLPPDKRSKMIIAEVDALFHQGNQNPGGVGYVDILRIADRIHQHFIDDEGGTPPKISGSIDIAKGFCSPSALESVDLIRNGVGAVLSTVGGLGFAWGIIYIIANGVFTTSGWLWWATRSLLVTGPFAVVAGIATLAGGLYMISKKLTFRERAIKGLEIIRRGIEEWGKEAKPSEGDKEMEWLLEMSQNECKATFCLVNFIANLDEKIVPEELEIITRCVGYKPGYTDKAYSDGIELTMADAVKHLRNSKFTGNVLELLKNVCTCDGPMTDDENEAIKEITKKIFSV